MANFASGTIGKIQGALASASLEATVTLANLNFDFSLVKVEAPAEYKELGKALSKKHLTAAETGTSHMTARKLGSLFQSLLPSTPRLFHAYGLRASEISSSNSVNREKDGRHGPFADYVGIDGTTIWAAATSSQGAIAAHLLACMLARLWPPAEATSIWEELVSTRKMDLANPNELGVISLENVVGAHLSISREQLAEWDASARAWLHAADQVEPTRVKQKQVLLIIENISVSISSRDQLQASVLKAWTTALTTMDSIIGGTPYSIQDGAIMLAMAAWHLYPDIVLLGPQSKEVQQHDPLIRVGGVVTLGLTDTSYGEHSGVRWSLSLSHLRYYGGPVPTERFLNSDSTRLTVPQFLQFALGCCFGIWGIPTPEFERAARLVILIDQCIDKALTEYEYSFILDDYSRSSWLKVLSRSASAFLNASGSEGASYRRLLNLGSRRKSFLAETTSNIFGLDGLWIVNILKKQEDQISVLRHVGSKLGVKANDLLIYTRTADAEGIFHQFLMTVLVSKGQTSADKEYHQHIRWHMIEGSGSECTLDKDRKPNVGESAPNALIKDDEQMSEVKAHFLDISRRFGDLAVVWTMPPSYYTSHYSEEARPKYIYVAPNSVRFDFLGGDANSAVLLARSDLIDTSKISSSGSIGISKLIELFEREAVDPEGLFNHFRELKPRHLRHSNDAEYKHRRSHGGSMINALQALASFARVYENLQDATIPSSVTQIPQLESKHWVLEAQKNVYKPGMFMDFRPPNNDPYSPPTSARHNEGDDLKANEIVGRKGGDSKSIGTQFGIYVNATIFEPRTFELEEEEEEDDNEEEEDKGNKREYNLELDDSSLHSDPDPVSTKILTKDRLYTVLPMRDSSSKKKKAVDNALKKDFDTLLGHPLFEVQIFSCIAFFESGFDIEPSKLSSVLAISSGDSLFISSRLLLDPAYSCSHDYPYNSGPLQPPPYCMVKRVIGNIGRPGTAFLIPPRAAKLKKTEDDSWNVINHYEFDGKLENSFQGTSLHLGFSGYEVPISVLHGGRFTEASFIEAYVSLYDCGKWVADLGLDFDFNEANVISSCVCWKLRKPSISVHANYPTDLQASSVENWEELLDAPQGYAVVKTYKNWQARLAAVCISHSLGRVSWLFCGCWRGPKYLLENHGGLPIGTFIL